MLEILSASNVAMKKIGLKEAVSIGIGGMVGGGIFAVLGLAVSLSRGGTPVSFLIAGIIALVTCSSYINLSLNYPDRGEQSPLLTRALVKAYSVELQTIYFG